MGAGRAAGTSGLALRELGPPVSDPRCSSEGKVTRKSYRRMDASTEFNGDQLKTISL